MRARRVGVGGLASPPTRAGSATAGCRPATTTSGVTGTTTTARSRAACSTSRTSRAGTGPSDRTCSSTRRRPPARASTARPPGTIRIAGRAPPTITRTAASRSHGRAIRATYGSFRTAGTARAATTATVTSRSTTGSTFGTAEPRQVPLPRERRNGGLEPPFLLVLVGVVVVFFVRRVAGLLGRDGDLLRRDLAGDDRDVDLVLVL